MAIVYDAEFVTEWHDPNPILLLTRRGERRLLRPGETMLMGKGKLELIKDEKGLRLRRISAKGNEVWSEPLHTSCAYKIGSKRMHMKKAAEAELDPIKKVLREMDIPVKVLRPFEGEVELEFSTSYATGEWQYSHHEAYYADGSVEDNMTERMYRGSYTAKVDSATCIVVIRHETEPVWSQTTEDVVDWTRETSWVKQVYVTDSCTPVALKGLLETADRDWNFRIHSLLSQWGLDVEVAGFQNDLVLDLDNDVFDVDFHTDCSGSREQLVYTDGKDEVDLEPQGVKDRHRIIGATVAIVISSTIYLGGHEVVEVVKIYLNKADFAIFKQLLEKANSEHTFDQYKMPG